jgi:hypothetical protein
MPTSDDSDIQPTIFDSDEEEEDSDPGADMDDSDITSQFCVRVN